MLQLIFCKSKTILEPSHKSANKLELAVAILFFASVFVQFLAGEAEDPPLWKHGCPHPLIERGGVVVPVEHAPLHLPASHLRSLPHHQRQHHPPQSPPPPHLPHEDVLHVQPRSPHEGRVIREA
ncbi:hypothetical protein HPP92_008439 [Vanilla planifolia]|uniref:Uncharacterized protein n=1 Tax=Vanilla planifolia TaxID=51239 RepID=A0A835V5E0_VANPL|nr:hypothetical protein HPP92_008439 [Vanilla planifolia]